MFEFNNNIRIRRKTRRILFKKIWLSINAIDARNRSDSCAQICHLSPFWIGNPHTADWAFVKIVIFRREHFCLWEFHQLGKWIFTLLNIRQLDAKNMKISMESCTMKTSGILSSGIIQKIFSFQNYNEFSRIQIIYALDSSLTWIGLHRFLISILRKSFSKDF